MKFNITDKITISELKQLENSCFNQDIYSSNQIQDILKDKNLYKVFGVEEKLEQKKIGYIIIFDNSESLEIMKIGVLPEYRRCKIGKLLIEKLLESDREVILEVREKNIGARKFYEKMGFSIIGRRKNYYQDDGDNAILMAKTLSWYKHRY